MAETWICQALNKYLQHMFSSRNKKNIIWIPPLICSYVTANLRSFCSNTISVQWGKETVRGNGYIFSENNSVKIVFVPFWKESTLNRNNLLLQDVKKVVSPVQKGRKSTKGILFSEATCQLQRPRRACASAQTNHYICCSWISTSTLFIWAQLFEASLA